MKKSFIFILLFSLLLSSCAKTQYVAHLGQATDSVSTIVGLSNGFVEGNPVVSNNLWILGIKPFLGELVRVLPEEYCVSSNQVISHGGFIPGIHNILLILGAPSTITWIGAIISVPIMYSWIKEGSIQRCQNIHKQE